MNQTQPVLSSQPHLESKRTLCAQIALRSFCENRKAAYTNANLFFDKKKNREFPNIRPSLHFYGMIILFKK